MIVPFQTIGDCHLGREFKTGVPLHRLGEREEKLFQHFESALNTAAQQVDRVIQVGDLFDKFRVNNNVLDRTHKIICKVAEKYPEVSFEFLNGNHDASKDTTLVSSFQILTNMKFPENVCFYFLEPALINGVAIIPWHPTRSAREQCALIPKGFEIVFAVGHWDVVCIDNDYNYVPVDHFDAKVFITGHDHNAREMVIGGKKVIVTGSLEPFSHAEDSKGELYITVDLADAYTLDPETVKDKNVRILLKTGEVPEGLQFDCLSLTYKEISVLEEEKLELEIIEHGFDIMAIFHAALSPEGLAWVKAQEQPE